MSLCGQLVQNYVPRGNVTSVQSKNCAIKQKVSDLGKALPSGNRQEERHEVRTSLRARAFAGVSLERKVAY